MRSAPWRGARVAGLIAGLLAWRCADIGTWNGLWCGLWVCYSLSPENSADISERTGSSSSEDESAQGGSDGGRSVRGSPSSEGLVVTALFHFVIVIAFATECYFCAAVAILLFIVAVPLECKRSFRIRWPNSPLCVAAPSRRELCPRPRNSKGSSGGGGGNSRFHRKQGGILYAFLIEYHGVFHGPTALFNFGCAWRCLLG